MPEGQTPPKPGGQPTLTGLTKRQQLQHANKTTFIWVAAAGIILSLSIVALQFLIREGIFNQRIISKKQQANSTLAQNIENVKELKQNVDALLANESLAKLRANPSDSALQVILDALPTTGDATTLSNSLYSRVLNRDGATISAVSSGIEGAADPAVTGGTPSGVGVSSGAQSVPFTVVFNGRRDQVRNTLVSMEKSIRPLKALTLKLEAAENNLNVTLMGETYFLPKSTVEVQTESIKP